MHIVFHYLKHIIAIVVVWVVAWSWSTYGVHKPISKHMRPTILERQYTLYQKQNREISDYQYGDLVLYYQFVGRTKGVNMDQLIGRVVGKPGDHVKMEVGTIIRNGKEIPEPYIKEKRKGQQSIPLVVVPKKHIFVLSDSRISKQRDSRYFGPIPDYCILGKVEKD